MEWITEEVPGMTIDGKVISTFLHKKQELVRCKDCKHYHAGFGCDLVQRPSVGKGLDWFCADGEKS